MFSEILVQLALGFCENSTSWWEYVAEQTTLSGATKRRKRRGGEKKKDEEEKEERGAGGRYLIISFKGMPAKAKVPLIGPYLLSIHSMFL